MNKRSILVIADDLTGAAEIGGIAVRYGLTSQIAQQLQHTAVTVQIINTDTRSLKEEEALAHVAQLFAEVNVTQWDWIYLKFDSALRGHMEREIPFYQARFAKERSYYCPVNLVLNRVIEGETYMLAGKPIAQTDFAHDPEFPVRSSRMLDAVGGSDWSVVQEASKLEADQKKVIPSVKKEEELQDWAKHIARASLCAGAAAFFESLLRSRLNRVFEHNIPKATPTIFENKPVLYVCGSKHVQSVTRIAKLDPAQRVYWQKEGEERQLAEELTTALKKAGMVVLAVKPGIIAQAQTIRKSMATIVAMLKEQCMPKELIVEGGSTARAVLAALHIDVLLPILEYAPGVIRNQVPEEELMVTLKPGSYPWTKELWAF